MGVSSAWPGVLVTAQLQTLDWRFQVKRSGMLRGLGLLLLVLVLGGLLHSEVVSSEGCTSLF